MSIQGLQSAIAALKARRFAEAIELLEAFSQDNAASPAFFQAQTYLVKAYYGNGQRAKAIALCQDLKHCGNPSVEQWATQALPNLHPPEETTVAQTEPQERQRSNNTAPSKFEKASRAARGGTALAMKGVTMNLGLAAGSTIFMLGSMIFVLVLALILIHDSENPTVGFAIATAITIAFNGIMFFLSPILMDWAQSGLYKTRWTDLNEIRRKSPESAKVLDEVCRKHNLATPRLGIIEDDNPTAFTYGSLPNSARLVVSRGLFKYLDDDEIATVYAHELGHIVHWDFAVMTLAATLVQVTYLLYVYAREVVQRLGNSDAEKKIKGGAQAIVWTAYVFYIVGEYLTLFLSRVREYHADHFAAEVTGNPNGLSRALVKIAYGILEQGEKEEQPSKVLQGTRSLGIADPRGVGSAGTAYRVASESAEVGRVFLWDMFNPWAKWMELSSTHPLTGKRVRALSNYAEQLGLHVEFNMANVMREGRSLNKSRLYGNFLIDLLLLQSSWLVVLVALVFGTAIAIATQNLAMPFTLGLVLFGIVTLVKVFVMYPSYSRAPEMDMLSLMSDPYASPLRGRAVQLSGKIIGRGNSGYRFGSEFQFQDKTGMSLVRYASRFGALGNFFFGWTKAESYLHQQVKVVGWFRRGMSGTLDLAEMKCQERPNVSSYPRFSMVFTGCAAIVLGLLLPVLFMQG
jgi:Zn-dependent protease with chaperone function